MSQAEAGESGRQGAAAACTELQTLQQVTPVRMSHDGMQDAANAEPMSRSSPALPKLVLQQHISAAGFQQAAG